MTGSGAYIARFTDFTVIAWLVVQMTDNPAAIGTLIFLRFLSFLMLGPFVGLVSDRFPRIQILRFSQAGIAALTLTLGLLLLTGTEQLWHLYLYTFVSGILFMFEISSRRPYISAVVGPKHITAAMALDMITLNVGWFLGANVGGLIVALLPAAYLYFLIAGVFALNVYLLRNLPVLFKKRAANGAEPVLRSLIDGIRYTRKNRLIMAGLLVVALNNFTGFTFESMTAILARDIYNAGPLLFGLLASAQGLGSVIFAVALVKYGKRIRRPALYMVIGALAQHIVGFGLTFAGLPAVGFMVLMSLGMLSMIFAIMSNTLILSATPDHVRGRVMGLQILAMGMFPLGSMAVGYLANAAGLVEAIRIFTVSGTLLLLLLFAYFPELRYAQNWPGKPDAEPVLEPAQAV